MKTLATALGVLVVLSSASAFACGFEGSVTVGPSNQKVHYHGQIASTWKNAKVWPENGWYTLELGDSACGENVELFANGCFLGRYRLPKSGNYRYDIHYQSLNAGINPDGCRR